MAVTVLVARPDTSQAQTTITECSFEDAGDTWSYTTDPAPFGSGDSGSWNVLSSLPNLNPTDGSKFWGVRDLDCPGGTSGWGVVSFSAVDVSTYISVQVSFDYAVDGFDDGDDLKYQVYHDGVGQGEVIVVDGYDGMQPTSNTVVRTIPNSVNSVRIDVWFKQNGGSDGGMIDNFVVEGVSASDPIITTSDPPDAMYATYGTASPAESYDVYGFSLTDPLEVSAPAGFEISTNGPTTGFAASLSLPHSGGTVSEEVWVRVRDDAALGAHSGNVTNSSTGATDVNIAVSGTVSLGAPTATAATGIWRDYFTANWTAVTGANGYTLEVASNNTFGAAMLPGFPSNVTDQATVSANVAGLQPSTTYYYRLKAYETTYESEYSNIRSVTTRAQWLAPTDILLSNAQIDENAGAATIGVLSPVDDDPDDSHTYTLVAGAGDDDNALFEINVSNLAAKASLNHEDAATRSVRVRATDQGSLTYEKSFTITVNDINEPATSVNLSNNTVPEQRPAGELVGYVSAVGDPDEGDTHVFSLPAYGDNASFTLAGTSLLTAAEFDYEDKSSYSVRIRSIDQGGSGLTVDGDLTVQVQDEAETPPTLSGTSVSSWYDIPTTWGATIVTRGGADITEHGVAWSLSSNPTPSDNKVVETDPISYGVPYSVSSGLLPKGVRIWFRGYATNAYGVGYSGQSVFFTEPDAAASLNITVEGSDSLTISWARANGDGALVLMREGTSPSAGPADGTTYTANSNFQGASDTIGSGKVVHAGSANSVTVTGLSPSVTYHVVVHSYAGSSIYRNYNVAGAPAATAATEGELPHVVTGGSSGITHESATLAGSVTNNGGSSVTERGIVLATHATPTTLDTKVADAGTGTGTFSVVANELAPGVTYYYRAYGINAEGTGYGSDDTFVPTAMSAPANLHATNVAVTQFDAVWDAVTAADAYVLDVSLNEQVGQELLSDRDFEKGDLSADWTANAAFQLENTIVHGGSWSAKGDSGGGDATLSQTVTLPAAADGASGYEVRFWYQRAAGGSANVQITSDAGGTGGGALPPSASWFEMTYVYTPPAGATTITVTFEATGGAVLYVDDASVRRGGFEQGFVSGYENRVVSNTSHTVTGLVAETTYYFRVKPRNNNGAGADGPYCSIVSVTTERVPSDTASTMSAPAAPITAQTISSLTDTVGEQVAVFAFDIDDSSGSDGYATRVTNVTIVPGPQNTAAWSTTVAGASLWYQGSTQITTAGVDIRNDAIEFAIADGNLNVPHGNSTNLEVKIHLAGSGLTDGGILQFRVSSTNHGFASHPLGSIFETTLSAGSVDSAEHDIEVEATTLGFVSTPPILSVNEAFDLSVETRDANGNVDTDTSGTVTITVNTGSGSLIGTTAVALSSGVASYTNLQFDAASTYTLSASGPGGLTGLSGDIVVVVDALSPGDLSFTGFVAEDADAFAIVTYVIIPSNSVIYFSDNELDGSGNFVDFGEGILIWNTGASAIDAGTVVTFSDVHTGTATASAGSLVRLNAFDLSGAADAIICYQGGNPYFPVRFIAGIANASEGSSYGSLANTGLTAGSTALFLASGTDVAQYTGSRGPLPPAAYHYEFSQSANWETYDGAGDQSGSVLPFNTDPFEIGEPPHGSVFEFQ